LYSQLYTTYKAVMVFYRAYQAEDALNARYGLWGTIVLALFDAFSISSVYDLYKAVFKGATRLIPRDRSCKRKGSPAKKLLESIGYVFVGAFFPILFYHLYAFVVRKISPGHPYYPHLILTTDINDNCYHRLTRTDVL